MRWTLGIVVVLHGVIHLLGAAKGLGWSSWVTLKKRSREVNASALTWSRSITPASWSRTIGPTG